MLHMHLIYAFDMLYIHLIYALNLCTKSEYLTIVQLNNILINILFIKKIKKIKNIAKLHFERTSVRNNRKKCYDKKITFVVF